MAIMIFSSTQRQLVQLVNDDEMLQMLADDDIDFDFENKVTSVVLAKVIAAEIMLRELYDL